MRHEATDDQVRPADLRQVILQFGVAKRVRKAPPGNRLALERRDLSDDASSRTFLTI